MPIERSIFLIGYRGTGKSTVAKRLAEMLESESVDSDHLVEQRSGRSIAEIFSSDGEPAFREVEANVVAELVDGPPRVIALGGGAVLCEATRRRLAGEVVVWLTASPAVLAARLAADDSSARQRPSLTGQGLLAEIEQVLAARTPTYQECATFVVDTETSDPEQVARQIHRQLSCRE